MTDTFEEMKALLAATMQENQRLRLELLDQEIKHKGLFSARQREERLRAALNFYGEERNYWEELKDSIFRTTAIAEDRGNKAREALSNEV